MGKTVIKQQIIRMKQNISKMLHIILKQPAV